MKIRHAIVAVALVATACGGGNVGEDPSAETSPATEVTAGTDTSMAEETTTTTSQTPTTKASTEPEETSVGDNTGADGQISSAAQLEGAKEDLARRLDVAAAEVTVVTQEEIVWRNGALGCPEEGMMYTQALVDGSLLILEVDGQQYEYHGRAGGSLEFCADPAPRK